MRGEGPPYYKLGARCVLYDLAEVEAWVSGQKAPVRDARPVSSSRDKEVPQCAV